MSFFVTCFPSPSSPSPLSIPPICQHILRFLPLQSVLFSARCTCRFWQSLTTTEKFWSTYTHITLNHVPDAQFWGHNQQGKGGTPHASPFCVSLLSSVHSLDVCIPYDDHLLNFDNFDDFTRNLLGHDPTGFDVQLSENEIARWEAATHVFLIPQHLAHSSLASRLTSLRFLSSFPEELVNKLSGGEEFFYLLPPSSRLPSTDPHNPSVVVCSYALFSSLFIACSHLIELDLSHLLIAGTISFANNRYLQRITSRHSQCNSAIVSSSITELDLSAPVSTSDSPAAAASTSLYMSLSPDLAQHHPRYGMQLLSLYFGFSTTNSHRCQSLRILHLNNRTFDMNALNEILMIYPNLTQIHIHHSTASVGFQAIVERIIQAEEISEMIRERRPHIQCHI